MQVGDTSRDDANVVVMLRGDDSSRNSLDGPRH